jgi:hypothetical protein
MIVPPAHRGAYLAVRPFGTWRAAGAEARGAGKNNVDLVAISVAAVRWRKPPRSGPAAV